VTGADFTSAGILSMDAIERSSWVEGTLLLQPDKKTNKMGEMMSSVNIFG
jgi:hypothetical protein